MKMRKSEHFVRSSSTIVGQTFNVKMTDKLFETLFSSLYKYKEAASLRETLCNGIDSHNMRDRQQRWMPSHYAPLTPMPQRYSKHLAPKGTPVVVHLPDVMEPWLEIKDYGVGLPLEMIIGEPITAREDEVLVEGNIVVKEDEIPDSTAVIGTPGYYNGVLVFRAEDGEIIRGPGLYTTLFHSTKEDDDGQIGAFGLGSKSPFAVSDSFTVESRYEGKLYRFLMYLNADRIPTVDLITKDLDTRDPKPEDTDEFNGLTVKVPVKNQRFTAFEQELVRLGRVMRPSMRPKVENASYSFRWSDINFENRVGNTYIQPKSDSDNIHYAVMGGVSYPIDLDQLDSEICTVLEKFPSSYTFFELGELNVPPSREDLSYDEFTRESLDRVFKYVADNIMQAKMYELRQAESMGPLMLYMKKAQLTDMFGSGFRKLVEREFPADNRFYKGTFRYIGAPDVVRDYSLDAPFRSIGSPYEIEVHDNGVVHDSIYVNSVGNWLKSKSKIAVIIDNSNRARNLKIQTARNNFNVVIVVKPNENYFSNRNQLAAHKESFTNHEELKSYFESWIGVQETTPDYLVFADKLIEVFGDLFNPDEVYFMHEMEYVRPTVEKDPGMFSFHYNSFNFDSVYELDGKTVSDIIDSGKKIVYIEVSGREGIHKIHGITLRQSAAGHLREAMERTKFGENGNENLFDLLGAHPTIVLARRKSVPMMKKFPEVFIPIDAVFDMLLEHYKDEFQALESKKLLKLRKGINIMSHRIDYGAKLLIDSHGKVTDGYAHHQHRAKAIISYAKQQITEEEWKIVRMLAKRNPSGSGYGYFRKAVEELHYHIEMPFSTTRFFRACNQLTQVVDLLNEKLTAEGFDEIKVTSTISQKQKAKNRYRVECHRLVKFMMSTYQPSAHNAIEDATRFVKAISKRILGA
ncbi:RIIA protein [Salmonella phage STP55]|nr:RIIA protein [Salmonella phage STP55]